MSDASKCDEARVFSCLVDFACIIVSQEKNEYTRICLFDVIRMYGGLFSNCMMHAIWWVLMILRVTSLNKWNGRGFLRGRSAP